MPRKRKFLLLLTTIQIIAECTEKSAKENPLTEEQALADGKAGNEKDAIDGKVIDTLKYEYAGLEEDIIKATGS